jgi:uncharacterized membrane protein
MRAEVPDLKHADRLTDMTSHICVYFTHIVQRVHNRTFSLTGTCSTCIARKGKRCFRIFTAVNKIKICVRSDVSTAMMKFLCILPPYILDAIYRLFRET